MNIELVSTIELCNKMYNNLYKLMDNFTFEIYNELKERTDQKAVETIYNWDNTIDSKRDCVNTSPTDNGYCPLCGGPGVMIDDSTEICVNECMRTKTS